MSALVLTRANSLASYAIRARLLESWSHAIIVEGPGVAVDATFQRGGVRPCNLARSLDGATEIKVVPLALPRKEVASTWLRLQLGKGYDWRAIWGFATFSREWADDYAWFCFELAAGYIEAGSDYRFRDRSRVTAKDLLVAARELEAMQRAGHGWPSFAQNGDRNGRHEPQSGQEACCSK